MSPSTCDEAWEGDRLSADHAGELAAHDGLSARDHSRDLSFLTDDYLGRLHITFNLAIDLQNAAADDLQPLADVLRSFPITDFSPLEGSLIDGWAPLGRAVRGSSGLGAVDELRVNMTSPNEISVAFDRPGTPRRFLAPHLFVAYLAIAVGEAPPRRRGRLRALLTQGALLQAGRPLSSQQYKKMPRGDCQDELKPAQLRSVSTLGHYRCFLGPRQLQPGN
jgi:hypothetical protein